MGSQSCGSCYVRSIVDRMKPRCLEGKPRRRETNTVRTRSRAEARQGTLEDILYSPQSIDGDAPGAPSPRRHSPKVCPLNMDCAYENNSPNVRESFSIDRMSLRSQNSIVRRVSFRLPDESDVFIIPARKDPDEYSTYATSGPVDHIPFYAGLHEHEYMHFAYPAVQFPKAL